MNSFLQLECIIKFLTLSIGLIEKLKNSGSFVLIQYHHQFSIFVQKQLSIVLVLFYLIYDILYLRIFVCIVLYIYFLKLIYVFFLFFFGRQFEFVDCYLKSIWPCLPCELLFSKALINYLEHREQGHPGIGVIFRFPSSQAVSSCLVI